MAGQAPDAGGGNTPAADSDLVDRIIVLENGKVVMDGPRDAILRQHGMAPQKAAQRTVTMKPAAVAEEGMA